MLSRVSAKAKSAQLQIRVSSREKAAIQRAARTAGMDMSAYVLDKVLPQPARRFDGLVRQLAGSRQPAFALAEINDFLSACAVSEFQAAVAEPPRARPGVEWANYLAAMIEYGAGRRGVPVPSWVRDIPPLERPLFGSELPSLRLYLLAHSPAPFRRRNIFIDATLGDRV
jgi:hypothetical protein